MHGFLNTASSAWTLSPQLRITLHPETPCQDQPVADLAIADHLIDKFVHRQKLLLMPPWSIMVQLLCIYLQHQLQLMHTQLNFCRMRVFPRYLFSFWMFAVKGLLALTIMINNSVPKIGEGLKISCLTSPVEFVGELTNTWIYPTKSSATTCFADGHVCTGSTMNYGFSADKNGVYATIYSLDRVRDSGTWTCIGSDNLGTNSTVITVYTLPTGVALTQDPNTSVDLSVSSVKLQCTTISCMYPIATVQWLYQDQSNPAAPVFYTTTNSSRTLDSCPNQEHIYTSTLDLPHYTTLSDNTDKTVTFSCRIVYLDPSINIMATGQHTIIYAVRVTEAVLQQDNQNITDTLTVTSGEVVTLTCATATSRPTPTIEWYLGSQKKGNGASLSFTPSDMDHSKTMHCQAYNIDISQTVFSLKPSLFVQVRVTEAVLQQNGLNITDSLTVTSGESVTLTCVTSMSRPAATIEWYVGSRKKGNGANLTFNPGNADHSEAIYCQAYNINPYEQVSSLKPRLFVIVTVSEVTFAGSFNGTILFHEGYIKILWCISSPSRPIAFIRWWLGNRQLTDNITNTGNTDSSGLYVLTSQTSITLTRDSINQTIYCDGYNSGQMTPAVSRKYNIDVLYAPDVNVTVSGTTLQNMTLIVLCEARGHPAEYMFHPWKQTWGDKVIRSDLQGTPNSNHNTLKLERLSLQQMGTYICSVDNNVTGSDGKLEQTGAVVVKVTGTPAILKEEEFHFAASVGHSINISIPFYSNPAIESFIFQKNGTGLQNNSRTIMNISTSVIDSKFYSVPVKLEAQMANLLIQNLTQDDFDIYTLVLVNFLGTKEFRLHLYAAVASTSESHGLPVAGIAGGISTGVVITLVVIIGIILWRRYQHTKKNQHENDVTGEDEERTRRNQINDVSVKQDVTRGKEYEGLNFTKAEATQYLHLNDITLEENTDPKARSTEGESYEKLHPYVNSDIEMYSSLKIPKTYKDSETKYENTRIKQPDSLNH